MVVLSVGAALITSGPHRCSTLDALGD